MGPAAFTRYKFHLFIILHKAGLHNEMQGVVPLATETTLLQEVHFKVQAVAQEVDQLVH